MGTWTCEYCHKEAEGDLPEGWDLFWQCAVCGDCQERAQDENGLCWLAVVRGGDYADGKPDPRERPRTRPIVTITARASPQAQ